MTTRTVLNEATVDGDELVIARAGGETRVDLRALLEWVALYRPDLLEPYLQQDDGDDE